MYQFRLIHVTEDLGDAVAGLTLDPARLLGPDVLGPDILGETFELDDAVRASNQRSTSGSMKVALGPTNVIMRRTS